MKKQLFTKAPELQHCGEKNQSPFGWGKAIRTHELEAAINNGLGNKNAAMIKLMYFLTANADGFKIAEKTVLQRCNISESGYKAARKKLVEMGWIYYKPGGYIKVNYNKIFSELQNKRGGYYQNTHEEEVVKDEGCTSDPDSCASEEDGFSHEMKNGFSENTHNNINNSKENRLKKEEEKDNGSRCEDTRSSAAKAAASQMSSQPLREIRYSREEMKNAERTLKNWYEDAYEWIACAFDMDKDEERKKMEQSDEYKNLLREMEEKREVFKNKYNCYPIL